MGLTHFDTAPAVEHAVRHLRGRWTFLGEAAGSSIVGLRRMQLPAGDWSTPAHELGTEEELFNVLAGSGLVWQAGRTAPIAADDGILFAPGDGADTIRGDDGLDLLAFGTRENDESPAFARLDRQLLGDRLVTGEPGAIDGMPAQFVLEAQAGPPELPDTPSERPATIVALSELEPATVSRSRVERTRRNFGRRWAGSPPAFSTWRSRRAGNPPPSTVIRPKRRSSSSWTATASWSSVRTRRRSGPDMSSCVRPARGSGTSCAPGRRV